MTHPAGTRWKPALSPFVGQLRKNSISAQINTVIGQLSEGWFSSLEEVPKQALTLTIPTLFRVPKLIVSVPGSRKAEAVRRTVEEPIATPCPSTLLRTHPHVPIYLDVDSAAELNLVFLLHSISCLE